MTLRCPFLLALFFVPWAGSAADAGCQAPKAGAWEAMATADGPELGEVVDVVSGFVGPTRFWLWNAYGPLEASRVFDASCNRWRKTVAAKGTVLPKQIDRRYGVLFGPGEVAVYAPTLEAEKSPGAGLSAAPLRIFLLRAESLEWTDVTPKDWTVPRDAAPVAGDGRILFWDERTSRGAVFTLATRAAEAVAEAPPLVGRGYDCSWLAGNAWLVANPRGVFRLDFAEKTWRTLLEQKPPMGSQELGACFFTGASGTGWAAMPRSQYDGARRILFAIDGSGQSAMAVPIPPSGPSAIPQAIGRSLWLADGSAGLSRFDRESGKWVPVAAPKGTNLAAASVLAIAGREALVEVPPDHPGTRARFWDGKRFGPTLELGAPGALDAVRERAQQAFQAPVAIDGAGVRVLDFAGKERFRLPAPPKWLAFQGWGDGAVVLWGVPETRAGNDCHNPFHPSGPEPGRPICTPSRNVDYTRIGPGGSVLLRAPPR